MKWPAAALQMWPIEDVKPRPGNPRTHTAEQVEQIARAMDEWGWTNPCLIEPDGTLIAGHGRLLAAQTRGFEEVPCIIAGDWTPEQVRAYVLADNKLALNAGWDDDLLEVELKALHAADFQLDLIGFSPDELKQFIPSPPLQSPGEPEPPPAPEFPTTRAGDIWILGDHRLMCGDSTRADILQRLVGTHVVSLLHADPPYGMGKESAGVANDNLYDEKLDAFQAEWWAAARPFMAPNASCYIWGKAPDLWRWWWRGLGESEPMTMRNEIVWDKKSIAGMKSEDLTQYREASERCLFFQMGRHVFLINQTKDDYWPGWEPLRLWMVEQRDAAGFTAGDVKAICGNHMYGHWFGQSQWVFITEDNYEKLAKAAEGRAFARPYAELLAEYRQLARIFNGEIKDPRAAEFAARRPYFDNGHDIMRDTWDFPRVSGEERMGHATPKPVAMMERVIKSSSREGEIVYEPFCGTGSTLIAAQKIGRRCFTLDVEPAYVDVTVARWESLTGEKAILEETGQTFEQVKDARAQT